MNDRRRWVVLAVGTLAQAVASCFVFGMPMLLPALRDHGWSLFAASLLISAPVAGQLFGLIPWGAAADRHGERTVIALGVGLGSVIVIGAAFVHDRVALGVLLALAGAGTASVNAASGRVVMGWFPPTERGLAMGVRQTAQPLGVALAALGLPGIAHAHGPYLALLYPGLLCLLGAVLVLVLVADPPRAVPPAGSAAPVSPYRGSQHLVRIHAASSLLVAPQFAVGAFTLVYLVGQRHWDPVAAGHLIVGFQVAGALGRVASGVWSDRVLSRLRPMRQLAFVSGATMAAIAVGAATDSWLIIVAFAIGAVVTVADNGLGYTAVAEGAGQAWAGRALGVQNTVQGVVAAGIVPVLAAVIGEARYALGFVLVAVFALIAVPMTPVRTEQPLELARGTAG